MVRTTGSVDAKGPEMESSVLNDGDFMLRLPAALVGAVLALAFAFAPAQSAVAQERPSETESSGQEGAPSEDFDTLVKRGREAYAAKKWKDSARAFEKAYDIKKVPNLLYNIGRVYENAGEFQKAVSFYQKFVNQPGIDIDNRKDALDRIETLEQIIDYSEREEGGGQQGGGSGSTNPGTSPGGGGGTTPDPTTEDNNTVPLVLVSAGGAGLISGTVFGILTANANSQFESADTLETRRDAADRGQTFSTLSDVLLISGGALTAAGVGLLIWPLQTQTAPDQQARLRPIFGPERAGLQLDLRF